MGAQRWAFGVSQPMRMFASEAALSSSSAAAPTAKDAVPALRLTDAAVARLKVLQEEHKEPIALRLVVNSGGCSGYQYDLKVDTSFNAKGDQVFERDGAILVTDELSLTFMEAAEIDFVDELIRSSFQVSNNKAADAACSCGHSFNLAF